MPQTAPAPSADPAAPATVPVVVTVNGVEHRVTVEPLACCWCSTCASIWLTGTHVGCDTSQCGACTVHRRRQGVKSCTMLAVQADGARSRRSKGSAAAATAAPDAGGFRETPWPAVRLLHAGHDHDRRATW